MGFKKWLKKQKVGWRNIFHSVNLKEFFLILVSIAGIIFQLLCILFNNNFSENQTLCFKIIFLIMIILYICIIILVINEHKREKIFNRNSEEEFINEYLYNLINKGGKCSILSRDMTWAENDKKMTSMLNDKAKKRELELYLEGETNLSRKLTKSGAKFYKLNSSPKVRFTLTCCDRSLSTQLSIAITRGRIHYIKEYFSGKDLIVNLAENMLNIAKERSPHR